MPIRADEPSGPLPPVQTVNWWIRQIHFCASMALAGLMLFYAATGFIANRANLLDTREHPVQRTEGTIPPGVALDAQPLAGWLARNYPGRLLDKTVDADGSSIRFEMESVWSWHEVTVDRRTRAYTVNTTPSTTISSMVGLHRGKWAGPAQKLIMDATALALIVVTCTGIYIGVTHPVRFRRWLAIGLVAGSVLIVLLLCLGR